MSAWLERLLRPRIVAVIGASDDPTRIGGRPIRYMREAGFGGRVLHHAQVRSDRLWRDLDRVGQGIAATGAGFFVGDPARVHRGADEVGCGLQSLWLGVRSPETEVEGDCARPADQGTDGKSTSGTGPARGGTA